MIQNPLASFQAHGRLKIKAEKLELHAGVILHFLVFSLAPGLGDLTFQH